MLERKAWGKPNTHNSYPSHMSGMIKPLNKDSRTILSRGSVPVVVLEPWGSLVWWGPGRTMGPHVRARHAGPTRWTSRHTRRGPHASHLRRPHHHPGRWGPVVGMGPLLTSVVLLLRRRHRSCLGLRLKLQKKTFI